MVNKRAGFWIRFLGRLIDLITFIGILIGLSFSFMTKDQTWSFSSPYKFYLWTLLSMVAIFLTMVLLPILTGVTIGMWITRIKIEYTGNRVFQLIKREIFFSVMWMSFIILLMVIVNHTLINKFIQYDDSHGKYTTAETFRVTLISTMTSSFTFVQIAHGISVIVRKNKGGWHDTFSGTKTVWMNKMVEEVNDKKQSKKEFRPRLVTRVPFEWKE